MNYGAQGLWRISAATQREYCTLKIKLVGILWGGWEAPWKSRRGGRYGRWLRSGTVDVSDFTIDRDLNPHVCYWGNPWPTRKVGALFLFSFGVWAKLSLAQKGRRYKGLFLPLKTNYDHNSFSFVVELVCRILNPYRFSNNRLCSSFHSESAFSLPLAGQEKYWMLVPYRLGLHRPNSLGKIHDLPQNTSIQRF